MPKLIFIDGNTESRVYDVPEGVEGLDFLEQQELPEAYGNLILSEEDWESLKTKTDIQIANLTVAESVLDGVDVGNSKEVKHYYLLTADCDPIAVIEYNAEAGVLVADIAFNKAINLALSEEYEQTFHLQEYLTASARIEAGYRIGDISDFLFLEDHTKWLGLSKITAYHGISVYR